MIERSYPNARDCEHGQLRRSCSHCEHDAEMSDANQTIAQLRWKVGRLMERVVRLEKAQLAASLRKEAPSYGVEPLLRRDQTEEAWREQLFRWLNEEDEP